ncbi:MAG: DMT family transporter [Candidatus Cohnella colombiensis]|uniref:DMT family transporter n=1 Tax=Candidatus Cohnella colombiensis TaxID=3121368 RepID=A0AA95F1L7_9BACL|nr:MAG: DMT family transporter [Cohnella sp.]
MIYVAVLFVILSGLIHSIWNLFTKKSVNKSVFLWFCQIAAVLIFLPTFVYEMRHVESIPLAGIALIVCSVITHGIYSVLLARTYVIGDLSQVYPIMRGISPLFVPLIGVLILNEHLSFLGWIGIVGIVIGIFIASDFKFNRINNATMKPILLAIIVGSMITMYTVIDKLSLQYVSPFVLNEITNVGNFLALSLVIFRSTGIGHEWKVNWKMILLGGLLAPGGYVLFLHAVNLMPVSQIAPMREIGTVFGTLFGILLLHEKQGATRIAASIIITAGVITLSL